MPIHSRTILPILVDLMASFNRMVHHLLLTSLKPYVDIKCFALLLFPSCITEGSFSVKINEHFSAAALLTWRVPHAVIQKLQRAFLVGIWQRGFYFLFCEAKSKQLFASTGMLLGSQSNHSGWDFPLINSSALEKQGPSPSAPYCPTSRSTISYSLL